MTFRDQLLGWINNFMVCSSIILWYTCNVTCLEYASFTYMYMNTLTSSSQGSGCRLVWGPSPIPTVQFQNQEVVCGHGVPPAQTQILRVPSRVPVCRGMLLQFLLECPSAEVCRYSTFSSARLQRYVVTVPSQVPVCRGMSLQFLLECLSAEVCRYSTFSSARLQRYVVTVPSRVPVCRGMPLQYLLECPSAEVCLYSTFSSARLQSYSTFSSACLQRYAVTVPSRVPVCRGMSLQYLLECPSAEVCRYSTFSSAYLQRYVVTVPSRVPVCRGMSLQYLLECPSAEACRYSTFSSARLQRYAVTVPSRVPICRGMSLQYLLECPSAEVCRYGTFSSARLQRYVVTVPSRVPVCRVTVPLRVPVYCNRGTCMLLQWLRYVASETLIQSFFVLLVLQAMEAIKSVQPYCKWNMSCFCPAGPECVYQVDNSPVLHDKQGPPLWGGDPNKCRERSAPSVFIDLR